MAVAQARRTHCPKGHPYDDGNTYHTACKRRICATCAAERWQRRHPTKPKPSLAEAIWSRFVRLPNGCWQWTGSIGNLGYGSYGGRPKWLAHRLVYTVIVGPIPEALVLDHLCRNRACVNPMHLEPVTLAENVRRGAASRKMEAAA